MWSFMSVAMSLRLSTCKAPKGQKRALQTRRTCNGFSGGKAESPPVSEQTVRIQEEASSSGSFLGSEAPQGDPEKQQQ